MGDPTCQVAGLANDSLGPIRVIELIALHTKKNSRRSQDYGGCLRLEALSIAGGINACEREGPW